VHNADLVDINRAPLVGVHQVENLDAAGSLFIGEL